METRTNIVVRGFNRTALQNRMNELADLVRSKKEQLERLKTLMKPKKGKSSAADNSALQKTRHALRQIQDEIKSLEGERLSLQGFMKTPGEGAVIVKKRIFPKVRLVIQGEAVEISEETMAPVYILKDGSVQSI
jgi:uncharacterized protein (DUF342 family)